MKRSPPVAMTLTLLCFIVTLVTLVTLVPSTNAQRATVSLGSKLIQPKDKKRKWGFFKSPGHVDAIELDEESDSEGEWIPIWTAGFVGLVSVMVFMMKVKQKRDGSESGDMGTRSDSTTSEEFLLENGKASEFLSQCEVGFEDIKMVLQQKGKKPDRVILDGSFKGNARPGRMLAIMGPSGSGKSTLLHAIAGRIKASKRIALSGTRYINQQKIAGDSHIPAAVIEQESNFFPHMTVKETLDFRVELKLGSQLPKAERDDVVANLMDMLGLVKSANTIVGDNKVRGLSGGERKRLSIACEMISSPPILLLDEPTSGLDSYQATQVMEYIRKLADSGKTVIAVIHQPSQKVFSLFDDLLLVSEGRMLYNGEVNNVRSYLHNLGFEAESDTGTAEHVLECISPNTNGGPEMEKKSKERLDKLGVTALDTSRALSLGSNKDHEKKLKLVTASNKTTSNGLRQFKLLLGRSFKELVRGKGAIIIKIVQQVTLGVIYGGIYKLGDNQASIMDRIGLISLITIGAFNMAMASTIRSFTKEKTIVSPEMAGGMYKTFPYFLAKAVSEIPIAGAYNAIFGAIIYPMTGLQKGKFPGFFSLTAMHTLACQAFGLVIGAIAPNTDVALSLFPPFIVLNIIFDGRNISVENTPRLLRWLPKIGVVKWAFQGLSINEFTGLSFSSAGPRRGPLINTGEDALAKFGLADVSLSEVFSAQKNIIGVCWLMSYLSLSLTKQKYQKMVTP